MEWGREEEKEWENLGRLWPPGEVWWFPHSPRLWVPNGCASSGLTCHISGKRWVRLHQPSTTVHWGRPLHALQYLRKGSVGGCLGCDLGRHIHGVACQDDLQTCITDRKGGRNSVQSLFSVVLPHFFFFFLPILGMSIHAARPESCPSTGSKGSIQWPAQPCRFGCRKR